MDFDKAVFFLKRNWYSKEGIVVAEIFSLTALICLTQMLSLGGLASAIFVFSFMVILFVFWLLSLQPPKTPKNKVGFLISIASSDEDDAKRVKEDLVIPLMQLVKSGAAGKSFYFIELPQHLAEKILDPDQAEIIRVKSRAHFMLYGRVRKRLFEDGKMYHFFEFEGVVAHQPISNEVSKVLSDEFGELIPRKIQIPPENDLFSFQFTSEWADLVSRYIIGIAAGCSGDIYYAEQLFDDVRDRLTTKDKTFPVFAKLNERLPVRKAEIYEGMATSIHRAWANSFDSNLIAKIPAWLDKIDLDQQQRPGVNALRAICAFVINKDANLAMSYVMKLQDKSSPIWNLNVAFLYGFMGDLKRSVQRYRAAARATIEIEAINQVEDFLNWAIEENPEIYQLNYCLGFFNWQIRGDILQAKSNLQRFIELSNSNFPKEKELASEWLKQIDKELNQSIELLTV
ncbi:MAG TPA: hypothetical protein VIE91_01160 [Methylophilaceae bacterium]|jgi:hypothetical protein